MSGHARANILVLCPSVLCSGPVLTTEPLAPSHPPMTHSSTDASQSSDFQRRGPIVAFLMLAVIMQALDGTIANVALPHMQAGISAGRDQITWVLTSYIVAAAIATPATSWLAARIGRRRLFLVAVAGFTAASVWCGLSSSIGAIVVARAVQGAMGAPLVPLSQAAMLDITPVARQGRAMAVWGAGVMVGPIMGPTLGGWITEDFGWRWVFFINVPIGLITLIGTAAYLREPRLRGSQALDLFGFATLSIGLGALQLVLDRGQFLDWFSSSAIVTATVISVVALAFFAVHTATFGARSFVDLRLLHDRNFILGALFAFLVGALMYATRALIPTLLQDEFGYPVMTTGLITAPSGIGTMVAMLAGSQLIGRIDSRMIAATGFMLVALSLWQMSEFAPYIDQYDVAWPNLVQGAGFGLIFVPLTIATFATLGQELRNEAAALSSLARNIGGSIGIATTQSLLVRYAAAAHETLASAAVPYRVAARAPEFLQYFDSISGTGTVALNAEVTRQAEIVAYLGVFRWMMIVALLFIPLLTAMRLPSDKAPINRHGLQHTE